MVLWLNIPSSVAVQVGRYPPPEEAEQFASSFHVVEAGTQPTSSLLSNTPALSTPSVEPSVQAEADTPVQTVSPSGTPAPTPLGTPDTLEPVTTDPVVAVPEATDGIALQAQNLVMVGLGILGDSPPNTIQPLLVDGIHLRWAFKQELGFPWYGFYLFRRLHREGDPVGVVIPSTGGSILGTTLNTLYGQFSSDQNLRLTDDFPPGGSRELDLDDRSYLCFTLPPEHIARWVEVRIGFRGSAEIEVTAMLWETPVAQTVVSGKAGDIKTVSLEFDAITAVKLGTGKAALIQPLFIPVSQEATIGWEPVPDFSYPLCLPLTHPDYPCAPGLEDLETARDLARSRIQYGNPDELTSPPAPIHTSGTIAVINGSPIVMGAGTDWHEDLVGTVLQVKGDSTAYTILMIVTPDKLVLSRHYVGASSTGTAYTIYQDDFGQLHDYLIHLVTGGSAASPMANRSIPVPVDSDGTIRVLRGSPTVMGIGTNWSPDLAGLALQIGEITTGTIEVFNGSFIVTGTGTGWSSNLVGLTLQTVGESREYTIALVNSPTQLILNRDYIGSSDAGKTYTIADKMPYTIMSVDSPSQLTLNRGYGRPTDEFGSVKAYAIVARLQPTESGRATPRMSKQSPLDLVLLSTVQPAIAQMIGLYWVDQKADPGAAYDYLILADYEGLFQGLKPHEVAKTLTQVGFSHLYGYIVFNKRMAPAATLLAPDAPRGYALPGSLSHIMSGDFSDASNNAGLRWKLSVTEQVVLLPDKPFMYHVWRTALGENKPTTVPSADRYTPITKERPILVTQPKLPPGKEPQRARDWPPYPMHAIDSGLPDGWYSYQVSGIDIFGRHSPTSSPAEWYQWQPVPDPRPWYYQDPPEDRAIHPFAVQLLDKMPPPPPTGIEAYALDPDDPTVLQDTAYKEWREANPEQVSLRVRWQWTQAHMSQAPDMREFRIYYYPGQINALLGHTLEVSTFSDTESEVETNIPNTLLANAYAGAWLRIGSNAFAILASESGGSLRLRVKNIDPKKEARPRAHAPCALVIPSNYTAGTVKADKGSPTVTGTGTGWREQLTGRTFKVEGESATYTVVGVDSDTQQMTLDRGYEGLTGSDKAYAICHPLLTDFSVPTSWEKRIYVVGYDEHSAAAADGDVWQYEIFLPAPDTDAGEAFAPSLAEPIVYAHIGVSAADDKTHTLDSPKWDTGGWGGRFGNEGRVGAPAKIVRVLRERPEPPVPPPDSERVFATPADYHGHSFYTYRWCPIANLKTHVFRALDDALFKTDWLIRTTRSVLEATNLRHEVFFPTGWVLSRQQAAADQLNAISSMVDYETLSIDAQEVLGQLPGNKGTTETSGLVARDWAIRTSRVTLSSSDIPYFPSEWTQLKRQTVAAELNTINEFNAYKTLSNDGMRILAGLPGNERAFTQLTIQPLDREDPDNANRKTPADPEDFEVGDADNPLASETLRIYIDTLNGRSTNRYFYRVAYVDGAHNRSRLSVSSPPVYLPNVVPPRAPVITKVVGGDRQITLTWTSNREPDLVEYRVYRADSKAAARDLRLMKLVHTETVAPVDPGTRPAEVVWVDTGMPVLKPLTYLMVAVDEAANVSMLSNPVVAQAYDDSRPAPPIWDGANEVAEGLELKWHLADPTHQPLVQRRDPFVNPPRWENVTDWLPAMTGQAIDTTREGNQSYFYRIRVLDQQGQVNRNFNELEV